ncbi:17890_t:CDS:2 [Cetraspora pellucida]|uniref:17890_t:CDS:1 n=1 Tax=Cetraspora pellucida TaxID=1433469 RepID=A0ACA9JWZ6_9GLOM|nr:17890_t:CDS:2 [Cetraspora pellucida]
MDDVNDTNYLYPVEYLNSLNPTGMPPSKLTLKVGCPVILLRNFASCQSFCNSSYLVITKLEDHVIEACILCEQSDCKIELLLFISTNYKKRDFDSQAIFKQDEFYPVREKIIPEKYKYSIRQKITVSLFTQLKILNKVPLLNKCLLKVSLIDIPQEILTELNNNENFVFRILVNNYAIQKYNFIVKIVYFYLTPRFKCTKETIQPQESLIFIVSLMEIIDNDFYIYAKEINNMSNITKNIIKDRNQMLSTLPKSTQSKLLFTHQNIKDTEVTSDIQSTSNNSIDEYGILIDTFHLSKCIKTNDHDKFIEDLQKKIDNSDFNVEEETEKLATSINK